MRDGSLWDCEDGVTSGSLKYLPTRRAVIRAGRIGLLGAAFGGCDRGPVLRKNTRMALYRIVDGLGPYKHIFGHDPHCKGLVPGGGGSLPFHLIATLDTSDPVLAPLKLGIGPKLRLVHHYHYNQGDSDWMTYRHVSPDEIVVVGTFGNGEPDWPHADLPRELPTRPLVLQPSQGNEPGSNFSSPSGRTMYVGIGVPTSQDYWTPDYIRCRACRHEVVLIARVENLPLASVDVETWGNSGVAALFFYCAGCQAITTASEM
jgi:hypothetical protein